MIVFLNGQFVLEEQAQVSAFDRGFLYGDGLFETMRICHAKPFRWAAHLERLKQGAAFLKIPLPFSVAALGEFAKELILRNQMPDSLLRLTLSRGVGPRGYSPKGARHPSLVMSLHPVVARRAARWRLVNAACRLPANEPLAQFKTCNKLPQIMARAQAERTGADEALLSNTDGCVVEGSRSNLFWIQGQTVCTAPLASGVLAGVTRNAVVELCARLSFRVALTDITPKKLLKTSGVFLSLSSLGIVEAVSLDTKALAVSPITAQIRRAYQKLVQDETT